MKSQGQILVVDDEPTSLKILRNLVESLDYTCFAAANGQEALDILASRPVDILITDIIMDKISGIELMQRAIALYPQLVCIAVSGYDEISFAIEAMKAGAINYIRKPLDFREVSITIEKGIDKIRLLREIKENQEHLERANRELERYRDDLEELVQKRTAELEQANLLLQEDIRARKKAEQEAERHRQQLIEADKMASLGILVAGVAHEINNPNNFITMNAPILQRVWGDCRPILERYHGENGDFPLAGIPYSEMRNHIEELFAGILDGAERIKKIVLNLKDYARQGISEMDQQVDINEALRSSLVLLSNPLKKSTYHLAVSCADNLPRVKGNNQRIQQVLINVIQNAYQSLEDPTKAIAITTGHDIEQNLVLVTVRDEGTGIPKKYLKQVRDPFFTTKRDCGGTGLGLSISAGIVEEHGGRLQFDSTPGAGTTVTISFPADNTASP